MDEYLTVKELSARIKFSEQTVYNMIHKGTFVLGLHYIKPTPKKILFKWSAMVVWLGDGPRKKEEGRADVLDYRKSSQRGLQSQGEEFPNMIKI